MSTVPGFVLIRQPSTEPQPEVPLSQQARTLMPKLAKALSRPGIPREVIFPEGVRHAYSYSIDPTDVSRIVRVDAAGRRTLGRVVGAKFVAIKKA